MGFLQQITWWLEAYQCVLESCFWKMTANSCFLIRSNCFYPSMAVSIKYMKTWCSLLKCNWQTWTEKVFKVGSKFVIWKGADLFLNPRMVVVLFAFRVSRRSLCSARWLFSCQIFARLSHPQLPSQIRAAFISCPSQVGNYCCSLLSDAAPGTVLSRQCR